VKKRFSVEQITAELQQAAHNGDMFYIRHNSDNVSIIDCCLPDDNRNRIVAELMAQRRSADMTRFISTHPDDDHI